MPPNMSTMQQSNAAENMAPTDGGSWRPPGEKSLPRVQTQRATDPRTSIEDYSRVMLEYTHHRMANFADMDDDRGSSRSRSSRGSETSGRSGTSSVSSLSKGTVPTSAGVSHHDFATSETKAKPSQNNSNSNQTC